MAPPPRRHPERFPFQVAARPLRSDVALSVAAEHPVATLLDDAAAGFFPPPDGSVRVCPSPGGVCDVVLAFTGYAVVAGEVEPSWVHRHVRQAFSGEHEHHPVLAPHFLAALAQRLGSLPAGVSMLLAATPIGADADGELTRGGPEPPSWADYREDVANFRYRGYAGGGSISVGRGPAGRWDVWIGHINDPGGRSSATVRGRELLHAAKALVPPRTPLFASVPIHSARSIRMALAAGFRPLGAEVLFPTRAPE